MSPDTNGRYSQSDYDKATDMGRSGKSGFTLIELVVVIAIIAILAAILFPVFLTAELPPSRFARPAWHHLQIGGTPCPAVAACAVPALQEYAPLLSQMIPGKYYDQG